MIRRGRTGDVDDLIEIEELCFQERRFKRENILWILHNPYAVTFVECEDRMRGAVMILMDKDTCRVLSIAVHPDFRLRGIGRALMAATEEHANSHEARLIKLEVSTKNRGAIEFYRKLGYETAGLMPHYYTWGDDAYAMWKKIPVRAKT